MKKNKYFKTACWILACAFISAGCAYNHKTEEMASIKNGKEEPEKLEMESLLQRIPPGDGAVNRFGMKIGIKILISEKHFVPLVYGITGRS